MGGYGAGIVLAVARLFARLGIIDARRGERISELAWPRMLTGVARLSQRIADFAMVGAVIGAPALAVTFYRFSSDAWLPAEPASAAPG